MPTITVALVIALAFVTCVALGVAIFALYLLARFSVSQGRFDSDAQQRAVNLQRYIDQQVERRVTYAPVRTLGPAETTARPGEVPPGVQSRGRIDDVHEAEREAARLRGEDYDPSVRDVFEEQPTVDM